MLGPATHQRAIVMPSINLAIIGADYHLKITIIVQISDGRG